jgi:hypothetical protein
MVLVARDEFEEKKIGPTGKLHVNENSYLIRTPGDRARDVKGFPGKK